MGKQAEKTSDVGVLVRDRPKTKEPRKFKVILWNDDYTSIVFVEKILTELFHLGVQAAASLTMKIHTRGKGVAGVYPRDIAETKAAMTEARARQQEYPLKATYEPD